MEAMTALGRTLMDLENEKMANEMKENGIDDRLSVDELCTAVLVTHSYSNFIACFICSEVSRIVPHDSPG